MSEAADRGRVLVERLSPGFERELRAAIGDIAPDLVEYTLAYPFGDVYSRPGLDVRDRQLITIAALTTLGAAEQLRIHLSIARNAGVARDEIAEAIIQLSVYAGWPRALTAMRIAAEVYG